MYACVYVRAPAPVHTAAKGRPPAKRRAVREEAGDDSSGNDSHSDVDEGTPQQMMTHINDRAAVQAAALADSQAQVRDNVRLY